MMTNENKKSTRWTIILKLRSMNFWMCHSLRTRNNPFSLSFFLFSTYFGGILFFSTFFGGLGFFIWTLRTIFFFSCHQHEFHLSKTSFRCFFFLLFSNETCSFSHVLDTLCWSTLMKTVLKLKEVETSSIYPSPLLPFDSFPILRMWSSLGVISNLLNFLSTLLQLFYQDAFFGLQTSN